MPAKADALAQRKEELRILARIERMDLVAHAGTLRRLRKPANFALIGARVINAWLGNRWLSGAAALLAARGFANPRVSRALRYAGYALAAWQTYRLFRQYATAPAAARQDRGD